MADRPSHDADGCLGLRPLIFAVLHHLIDRLLRSQHRLDTSRRATVDCCLQYRLPDLDFREAIVDRAAGVQCQLHLRFLGDGYAQVYHMPQALVSRRRPVFCSGKCSESCRTWKRGIDSTPCVTRHGNDPGNLTYSEDCAASCPDPAASRCCPRPIR